MGDVKIRVNSVDLPAFVSVPAQPAPWPGVVVLHDVAGMSEDLRNQTRWLAKGGFLAAAPNLLFRGGKMKCLFALARDLKARQGPTYDDVEAVRTWLIKQPECTGKIGVIRVLYGRRVRVTARAGAWIRSRERELWRGPAARCPDLSCAGMPDRRQLWGQRPLDPGRGAAA